jgi:hypothetical protein
MDVSRKTGSSAFADDDGPEPISNSILLFATTSLSRRVSRASFAMKVPPNKQRAQGMPGARCARSLVCEIKKHTSIVTTVTPEPPGIPYATVLTVSFVLSLVIGRSCHHRRRIIPPT